jgi:SAM-dependent methyltransferase
MKSSASVQAGHTYHEVHLTRHPAREAVWKVLADFVAPWIPDDSHVLELGAGYCDWINAVRARRKVALDSWPEFPLYAAPDVEPLVFDAVTGLGKLGVETFDVVIASNFLEHFEADVAWSLVRDVTALLRPGGRFIVIQPNFRYAYRKYFDDYTHRSVFTDTSLGNLLRAHGFRVELSRPKFLPYSMRGIRTSIPAWLIRAYLRSPVKPFAGQMLIVARKV